MLLLLNVLLLTCSVAPNPPVGEAEAGDECVAQYDWCHSDQECCDGLGCDFPPGDPGLGGLDSKNKVDGLVTTIMQAGVCRSVRESLCALKWEHCDVFPCCNDRPCTCYGDWVVECSCE